MCVRGFVHVSIGKVYQCDWSGGFGGCKGWGGEGKKDLILTYDKKDLHQELDITVSFWNLFM